MAKKLEGKIDFLARRAFETGAVKIDLKNPFVDNEGRRIPIEFIVSRLFERYEDRRLIAEVLGEVIEEKGPGFDFIVGINTLSLVPASVLVRKYNIPLVVLAGNLPFRFLDREFPHCKGVNYFVSASRLATPYASEMANRNKARLFFLKLRKHDADFNHSKDSLPGERDRTAIVLVGESEDSQVQRFYPNRNAKVREIKCDSDKCLNLFDLTGKRGLVIGTLLGDVRYFTKDFESYKGSAASSFASLHLFSYNFRGTDAEIKKQVDFNRSVLHLDRVLEAGVEAGNISKGEMKKLISWRKSSYPLGN